MPTTTTTTCLSGPCSFILLITNITQSY